MSRSERTDASSAVEIQRRRSCALCNKHKVKCIGGVPCRHCIESKQDCTPQGPGARSVLQRVASLERDRGETQKQVLELQRELAQLRSLPDPSCSDPEKIETAPPSEVGDDDSYSNERDSTSRQGLARDPPEEQPYHEDEEDITLIDTIRFGKRKVYEDAQPLDASSQKRARKARPEDDIDNMLVMEKVSLDIFFQRCAHKLPFIPPEEEIDLPAMRSAGSMLYWTMVAAGSREALELSPIHRYAEDLALASARSTLFGRQAALDDIRGMLVNWMFLNEARSPGHVVGMAHDLRLSARCLELCKAYERQKGMSAFDGSVFREVAELQELLRLDGYLFMVDRVTAAVTDRPQLIAGDNLPRTCAILLDFENARLTDIRLVAQVEIAELIANVRLAFSQASAFRDNISLIPMWSDHLDRWLNKWNAKVADWRANRPGSDAFVSSLVISLHFLYETSRLHINAFPLQGLRDQKQLTPKKLQCVNICIHSARSVCVQAVRHNQPDHVIYTSNMTQFQLCYAAVFLLRMIKLLPGQLDEQPILTEVEDLSSLLSQISGSYYSSRIFQMLRHLQHLQQKALLQAQAPAVEPTPLIYQLGNASWDQVGGSTNGAMTPATGSDIKLGTPALEEELKGIADWDIELGIGAFWDYQSVLDEV